MKKIFSLLFVFISAISFAQVGYPVIQAVGNAPTTAVVTNAMKAKGGFIDAVYNDTISANLTPIDLNPFARIGTSSDNKVYFRNAAATKWIEIATGGSVLPYVDTVFVTSGGLTDSLWQTKNGVNTLIHIFDRNCGLVQPGVVTYDSLFVFTVSPAVYVLCSDGVRRTSVLTNVTLAASHPSLARRDAIILNSSGVAVLTGTPSATPVDPQITPSQILLTYITVPAGATAITACTPGVTIYDENVGSEWPVNGSSVIVNESNTLFPFHLTKSTDVGSYVNASLFNWTSTTPITLRNYTYLKFRIRLKIAFTTSNYIRVSWQTPAGYAENVYVLHGQYGFNATTVGSYQTIIIPMTDWSSSNPAINYQMSIPSNVVLSYSLGGTNSSGFYIDYIQLGGGGNCVDPPPTPSNTNYVENVFKKPGTDTVFQVINGLNQFAFRDSLGNQNDSVYVNLTRPNDSTIVFRRLNFGRDTVIFRTPVAVDTLYKVGTDSVGFTIANRYHSIYTGSGSTYTSENLTGLGVGIYKTTVANAFQFKRLKAGSNVTITDNTDSVTIAAASYTVNNGLTATPTATNFRLGGLLVENTWIYNNGFTLLLLGNMSSELLNLWNQGTGQAIYAKATSNTAVYALSASSYGIEAESVLGIAGRFSKSGSNDNTVGTILSLYGRGQSGFTSAGHGISQDFRLKSSDATDRLSNQIISRWTTATDASRTSQLDITGVNAGTTETWLNLQTAGIIRMNNNADTVASRAYARSVGGSGSTGITIGTTTITSGTDTRVLYNNSGVVGEYVTSGTGDVVRTTSPTFVTSLIASYATASTIAIFDGSKNLISAALATYPSLTELSYGKGVTSAIQTQIDSKLSSSTAATTYKGIADSVLSTGFATNYDLKKSKDSVVALIPSYTGSKSVLLTSSDFTLVNDSTSFVAPYDKTKALVYGYERNGSLRGWKKSAVMNTTTLADGDLLKYNASDSTWKNFVPTFQTVIADFYADAQNSSTSETDLYSYTTEANTLNNNGDKISAIFSGTFNDVTATSQVKIYFGDNVIANTGALTVSSTGGWKADVLIIMSGSTTARAVVNISTPGASTALYTTETDITGLTLTGTNIIKITGQAGGASGGSSDITGKMGTISKIPKAN